MINLIVAHTLNNVIGKDGMMPWDLPEDLEHFKNTTMGHMVVMGRKTFESIGRPLPGRKNLILSRSIPTEPKDKVAYINDYKMILGMNEVRPQDEFFIIGGAEIYNLFLPHADRIYRTLLYTKKKGDTFFPEINKKEWEVVSSERGKGEGQPFVYFFEVLERGRG